MWKAIIKIDPGYGVLEHYQRLIIEKQRGVIRMKPEHILEEARKRIRDHAKRDLDKWFYANRYVFARLQLDERKTKTEVKRRFSAQVSLVLIVGNHSE